MLSRVKHAKTRVLIHQAGFARPSKAYRLGIQHPQSALTVRMKGCVSRTDVLAPIGAEVVGQVAALGRVHVACIDSSKRFSGRR